MADKKPIVKKTITPKVAEEKLTAKLSSYTVKTLISTGEYSNIQIEMVVTDAHDLADAQNLVQLHIDELHKYYYNILTKKLPNVPVGLSGQVGGVPTPKGTLVGPTVSSSGKTVDMGVPPKSSAFTKAEMAVKGARTIEALETLAVQIGESVRLVAKEKSDLFGIISECRLAIK